VGDASLFRSARHFAAWLGLVPKQRSSGAKQRQGGISKQGNPYLRRLLVVGATAVIRHAGGRLAATPSSMWAKALLERRPARLVSYDIRVISSIRGGKLAVLAWERDHDAHR
jgi:transposase